MSTNRFLTIEIAPTEKGVVVGNSRISEVTVELLLESGALIIAAASFPLRLAD